MWNFLSQLEHESLSGVEIISQVAPAIEQLLEIFGTHLVKGESARNAAIDAIIAILQAEKTPEAPTH